MTIVWAPRWKSFSLRTLFVLMTLCCLVIGAWSVYVNPYRVQSQSLGVVNRLQGTYVLTTIDGHPWQRWLVTTLLGEEAFVTRTSVNLSGRKSTMSRAIASGLVFLQELASRLYEDYGCRRRDIAIDAPAWNGYRCGSQCHGSKRRDHLRRASEIEPSYGDGHQDYGRGGPQPVTAPEFVGALHSLDADLERRSEAATRRACRSARYIIMHWRQRSNDRRLSKLRRVTFGSASLLTRAESCHLLLLAAHTTKANAPINRSTGRPKLTNSSQSDRPTK